MSTNSRFDLTTLSSVELNNGLETATKSLKGIPANSVNFAAFNTLRNAYLMELRRRLACGIK